MPQNELFCLIKPSTLTKSFTTLLIDDSAAIRQRVRELLRKITGSDTILAAANYAEAVDLVNRSLPRIAILDLHFPGGSGIDLIPIIKKSTPDCCVIVFTNSTDPIYKNCCLRYGADHFFDKSMEIGKLVEVVGSLYETVTTGK